MRPYDRTVNQQIRRHPERARTERDQLDAILDSIPVGVLSTVVDGRPWVVPMLFARDGDRVLLHGSTGAGALRHVAQGAPAALCVMLLDGMVVADSTFNSSANYRSAVVHGPLTPLQDDDKWTALNVLADHAIPGRVAEVRDMTKKEQAATLAVWMPITDGNWTVKVRTGPPSEPDEVSGVWEGVLPIQLMVGQPQPAPWIAADHPPPDSVHRLIQQGWAP